MSVVDPSSKEVLVTLSSGSYRLRFSYGAIMRAEGLLRPTWPDVSLLDAMGRLNATSAPALFYAAASDMRAGLEYDAFLRNVKIQDIIPMINGIVEAWRAEVPAPKTEEGAANPTEGGTSAEKNDGSESSLSQSESSVTT